MADYILIRKSRNALSSFLHVIMNILLGVISIFITIIIGNPTIGIILVLASKWRTFAVHSRYWLTSVKSNLVDIIVGISLVLLAFYAGTTLLPIHFLLAAFYVVWLLFIKPISSENGAIAQAITAVFLGTCIASIASATVDSSLLVLLEFFIGYSASRHVLVQNEEGEQKNATFLCGIIFAEISWISYSWLIVYNFTGTGIIIPQLAIILSVFLFAFNSIWKSLIKHDGKIKASDIALPTIFSTVVVVGVFLFLSQPIFNI